MAKRQKDKLRLMNGDTPRRGVYLIPNLLTSGGLFCGVFSLVQTMNGHYASAAIAILVANVFDGLDGRVARMTNTTSRFGVEYDSLCDLVSFGVAPAILIYQWALVPWGVWGWSAVALYVACAAVRLARFNITVGHVDENHFVGLPVPAAGTMLVSLILMYGYVGRSGLPDKQVAVLLLTYALAMAMVSSIAYPSFKKLQLHKRQPMGAFVMAVVLLTVAVAAYELFIFSAAAVYVASGPALILLGMWRSRRLSGLSALSGGSAGTSGGMSAGNSSGMPAGGSGRKSGSGSDSEADKPAASETGA